MNKKSVINYFRANWPYIVFGIVFGVVLVILDIYPWQWQWWIIVIPIDVIFIATMAWLFDNHNSNDYTEEHNDYKYKDYEHNDYS